MSGLTGSVLLRQSFEEFDTGRVTAILKSVVDQATETRKGRHWDFVFENATGTLDVVSTTYHWYDYEGILDELGLNSEDVPEVVVIAFALRRESDRIACDILRSKLITEFEAIDCGIYH